LDATVRFQLVVPAPVVPFGDVIARTYSPSGGAAVHVAVTDVAVDAASMVKPTPPTDTVGRRAELVLEQAPLAAAQKPVPVIDNDVGVPDGEKFVMMDVTTGAAIALAEPSPSAAAIPNRSILEFSRILSPPTVSLNVKS
jgi:hypothetical protein